MVFYSISSISLFTKKGKKEKEGGKTYELKKRSTIQKLTIYK